MICAIVLYNVEKPEMNEQALAKVVVSFPKAISSQWVRF